MRKIWFVWVVLFSTNYPVYSSPSESDSAMILSEAMLDSVTAGAASSTASASAEAAGSTFAQAAATATTYAAQLGKTLHTGATGVAVAQGDSLAAAGGSSTSSSGATGVSVEGTAIAMGGDAYVSVWSRAITTPGVNVAIGHVRSVACCGPDADTSAQTTTFTDQTTNVSLNRINDVNTPNLSLSIGNAVVVSQP